MFFLFQQIVYEPMAVWLAVSAAGLLSKEFLLKHSFNWKLNLNMPRIGSIINWLSTIQPLANHCWI